MKYANNKGADQAAHLRSLVSAFVIRHLESTIGQLAPCKISIVLLFFVAGLRFTCSKAPKTGFQCHMAYTGFQIISRGVAQMSLIVTNNRYSLDRNMYDDSPNANTIIKILSFDGQT